MVRLSEISAWFPDNQYRKDPASFARMHSLNRTLWFQSFFLMQQHKSITPVPVRF